MNKKYQNSSSTYDITSQIYNECYNEENPTTTIEPVQVKTTEVQNPSVNTSPVTPSSVTTTPVSSSVRVSESPSPESANSPISEVPIDGDSTTKAEMENTVSTGMIIVIAVCVFLLCIFVPLILYIRNRNKKKTNTINPNTTMNITTNNNRRRNNSRNNSRITSMINKRNNISKVPYSSF
jgi:cobalamin biosynthesis Mg chelatase CobN